MTSDHTVKSLFGKGTNNGTYISFSSTLTQKSYASRAPKFRSFCPFHPAPSQNCRVARFSQNIRYKGLLMLLRSHNQNDLMVQRIYALKKKKSKYHHAMQVLPSLTQFKINKTEVCKAQAFFNGTAFYCSFCHEVALKTLCFKKSDSKSKGKNYLAIKNKCPRSSAIMTSFLEINMNLSFFTY